MRFDAKKHKQRVSLCQGTIERTKALIHQQTDGDHISWISNLGRLARKWFLKSKYQTKWLNHKQLLIVNRNWVRVPPKSHTVGAPNISPPETIEHFRLGRSISWFSCLPKDFDFMSTFRNDNSVVLEDPNNNTPHKQQPMKKKSTQNSNPADEYNMNGFWRCPKFLLISGPLTTSKLTDSKLPKKSEA